MSTTAQPAIGSVVNCYVLSFPNGQHAIYQVRVYKNQQYRGEIVNTVDAEDSHSAIRWVDFAEGQKETRHPVYVGRKIFVLKPQRGRSSAEVLGKTLLDLAENGDGPSPTIAIVTVETEQPATEAKAAITEALDRFIATNTEAESVAVPSPPSTPTTATGRVSVVHTPETYDPYAPANARFSAEY